MRTIAWRKAGCSAPEVNCVEVAGTLDAMRDSKNTAGPILTVNAAALVAAVKADRISR